MFKFILPTFKLHIEKWKWNKEYRIYVSNFGHFKDEHKRPLPVKVATSGYLMVKTACGLKLAHRIVMFTWVPIPGAEDLTVDHLDHNKRNNSVDNLEWVTLEENQRRAKKDLCQDCPIQTPSTKKYRYGHSQAFDTIDEAVDWAIENFCHTDNAIRKNVQNKIINSINTGKLYCGAKWRLS